MFYSDKNGTCNRVVNCNKPSSGLVGKTSITSMLQNLKLGSSSYGVHITRSCLVSSRLVLSCLVKSCASCAWWWKDWSKQVHGVKQGGRRRRGGTRDEGERGWVRE